MLSIVCLVFQCENLFLPSLFFAKRFKSPGQNLARYSFISFGFEDCELTFCLHFQNSKSINDRRFKLFAISREFESEKAEHELTKQQVDDFISRSDQREQKLHYQLQASQTESSIVTNRLAVAEKNQLRTEFHLAPTQKLLPDSQKLQPMLRSKWTFFKAIGIQIFCSSQH